jgi:hypothetical protein
MRNSLHHVHAFASDVEASVRSRHSGAGSIHHFGVRTDDMAGMLERLRKHDVQLRKPVTDLGGWRYVMVPGPDDVLIELFEVTPEKLPAQLGGYF